MTETERMQQLHHRSATGQVLADEDRAALEVWYETLDREEEFVNGQNRLIDLEALRETVAERTAQIAVVGAEVAVILKLNEELRRENAGLRRQFEARLVEEQKIAA